MQTGIHFMATKAKSLPSHFLGSAGTSPTPAVIIYSLNLRAVNLKGNE